MSSVNFDARFRPQSTAAGGRPVTFFSGFARFGNPRNARELVENNLFYRSASRFDVFTCFSSHMSTKPAILQESSDRIVERFGAKASVTLKELGAGHGDSMAFLLGDLRARHPEVFAKTTAFASDGYEPVVEEMRHLPQLQPFFESGKLVASHEDLMGKLPSQTRADYVRISYTLTDLPEDIVLKENGRFYLAYVRGFIKGDEPFQNDKGQMVPTQTVARLLFQRRIDEIFALGLDIRQIQPRVGYETQYRPLAAGRYTGGTVSEAVLQVICGNVEKTYLRLGLNASRAVEKILAHHLASRRGSTIEIFDIWTASILENMPVPFTALDLTSVNSVNLPFLREYLRQKGVRADVKFEDWKQYIGLREPYIYLSHFSKWLKKDPEDLRTFFGRAIPSPSVRRIVDFLERTKHVADMALYREKETHPALKLLRKEGFSEDEIELLFSSEKFPEPDKSQSRGYSGLYQIVTIRR